MPDPRSDYLAARRDSIREAAERVFVRHGFDGATMQEIADEAGVAAGSIYRYFESKAALIREVARACGERYAAQLTSARQASATPFEALTAGGALIWEGLQAVDARDNAMLQLEATLAAAREPSLAAPLAEALGDTHRLLAGLIRDAQAAGELDASVDPEPLAWLLIAVTGGMQTLGLQLGEVIDSSAAWRALQQLLAGIRSEEEEA